MAEQERKNKIGEERLTKLEARIETSPTEFFTIAGFASLKGIKIDVTKANALGRRARLLSDEYGYNVGRVSDPRFGTVNSYHTDILGMVFK